LNISQLKIICLSKAMHTSLNRQECQSSASQYL